MRVNDDYQSWNAASELEDKDSVFSFWKRALEMRMKSDVFVSSPVLLIRLRIPSY